MSTFEMLFNVWENEGLSGFYKGIIPSLILTINPIIQYIIYENMRAKLIDSSGYISSKNIILISAFSKLVTTLFTYPILTVKTLYQSNEKRSPKEIKDIVIENIKQNGFLYLYKGILFIIKIHIFQKINSIF